MSDEPDLRRFAGVVVPDPAFAHDDGTLQPALGDVLAAYDVGLASVRDVAVVLAGSRLMTPLVAVLDEAEESPDGPARRSPATWRR